MSAGIVHATVRFAERNRRTARNAVRIPGPARNSVRE